MAVQNLRVGKLRSFLAILGVLVGTASVVALVSGGQIATQNALAQFKTLGTDLLSVSINDTGAGGAGGGGGANELTLPQSLALTRLVPGLRAAAPYTLGYGMILFAGRPLNGEIVGATRLLQSIAKIDLQQGRFISDLDKNEYYCVIGATIAKDMARHGVLEPIGKQIQAGGFIFTIIGVAGQWMPNQFLFSDINTAVIIPLPVSLLMGKYVNIRNIIFRVAPDADIARIKADLTQAINARLAHKELFFQSAEELIAGMAKQHETFTWLLGFIGGISLLVGGIGVMNIMLVSVAERRREIGIRLAVGAKPRDIEYLFLVESLALTIGGGLLGVVAGILISYLIALFAHWTFQVFLLPPFTGFAVSALVGIFFGYYPARKASQLDPIEALRTG